MKVSNGTNIQRIYQEQLKKVHDEGSGDAFKKIMQASTPQTGNAGKAKFHPPSGVNLTNPAFSGKPVKEADPAETMKFAAEVVAAQPDIREERINKLKELINSGRYNVSPEEVATKLLQSGVLTKSWEA